MSRSHRPRRSCLAVPGSNPRFLEKARDLEVDQVFLDLEDACAPAAKPSARRNIVAALSEGGWKDKARVVRVNDWTTAWTFRDVQEVVEGAGQHVDCIMLPKVASAEHVVALDLLLSQLERSLGLEPGGIGIEAQIEDANGLLNVASIAAASPRMETLIFGPADFMANLNMKSLVVGAPPPGYPGDAFHSALMGILLAARANGLQAIDGPYALIRDADGYAAAARKSAALGYDGKWVLNPSQIEAANAAYSPSQSDFDRAENILDAYAYFTSKVGGERGAVMLDEEMIDEASRKMALVISAKGRAAALTRRDRWLPPKDHDLELSR